MIDVLVSWNRTYLYLSRELGLFELIPSSSLHTLEISALWGFSLGDIIDRFPTLEFNRIRSLQFHDLPTHSVDTLPTPVSSLLHHLEAPLRTLILVFERDLGVPWAEQRAKALAQELGRVDALFSLRKLGVTVSLPVWPISAEDREAVERSLKALAQS